MESKERLLEIIKKEGHGRFEYLNDLFRDMPETVAKEMIYTEVKKNEFLVSAGSRCETIFIILDGHVIGLDYQKMGQVYSFMDFTQMYIVGDFEVFSGNPEYCVSVRTARKCKLLKISANSYLRWIRHDEHALFLRMNNILTTLTFERRMDREYLLMGCKERLIDYLVRFYEKNDKNEKIKVEKTQMELADKVGFNVRSIQRNIALLEKEKMISLENGKMTITRKQYAIMKDYMDKKRGM